MRLTVKYKLLLPILATVIIGMAAIQTLTGMKSSSVLEGQIFDSIGSEATTAATQMDLWLTDRLTDFTNWSKNHLYGDALAGDPYAIEDVNNLLKHKPEDYPYFNGVNLIDSGGIVIASSHSSRTGLDLSSRGYFKEAMTGKGNISSPLVSKATGKPHLHRHPTRP